MMSSDCWVLNLIGGVFVPNCVQLSPKEQLFGKSKKGLRLTVVYSVAQQREINDVKYMK